MCAPEAIGLVRRQQSVFCGLYPRAAIRVDPGTSREAIGALFGARCDLAVIVRELEPEERESAVRGGLRLQGYRFARDAVVMVVNPSNPVENVAIEDVRRIYRGETRRWSELGGPDAPVVPVVQPPRSDIAEFFSQQVMGGGPVEVSAFHESSDSGVVARVKREPNAVGYVSLAGAGRGGKTLRLASLGGLPYWKPDLEAVYRGEYPLTRFFNVYGRADGPSLANGFITFVTSVDGQRLVRDAQLVPTTVPVRFVRRSPMLKSHP